MQVLTGARGTCGGPLSARCMVAFMANSNSKQFHSDCITFDVIVLIFDSCWVVLFHVVGVVVPVEPFISLLHASAVGVTAV